MSERRRKHRYPATRKPGSGRKKQQKTTANIVFDDPVLAELRSRFKKKQQMSGFVNQATADALSRLNSQTT